MLYKFNDNLEDIIDDREINLNISAIYVTMFAKI